MSELENAPRDEAAFRGNTVRALGRLEGKMDTICKAMPNLVTYEVCEAKSGGIAALLDAHKAEIVKAVEKNGNGAQEALSLQLVGVLRKGLALVGSGLALLTFVLYYFLK